MAAAETLSQAVVAAQESETETPDRPVLVVVDEEPQIEYKFESPHRDVGKVGNLREAEAYLRGFEKLLADRGANMAGHLASTLALVALNHLDHNPADRITNKGRKKRTSMWHTAVRSVLVEPAELEPQTQA